MAYLMVGASWTLLLVLAASAVGKLRAFDEFRRATAVLVPAARPVARPLALPVTARAGLVGAAALLAAFTVVIAAALRRGATTACRCFGASTTPIGRRHLARNTALLAVAAAGLAGAPSTAGAGPAAAGLVMTAAVSAVLAVLAVSTDALVDLFTTPSPQPTHPRPEGATP